MFECVQLIYAQLQHDGCQCYDAWRRKEHSEDSFLSLGKLYMQQEMEIVTDLQFYYNSVSKEKCLA